MAIDTFREEEWFFPPVVNKKAKAHITPTPYISSFKDPSVAVETTQLGQIYLFEDPPATVFYDVMQDQGILEADLGNDLNNLDQGIIHNTQFKDVEEAVDTPWHVKLMPKPTTKSKFPQWNNLVINKNKEPLTNTFRIWRT